MIYRIIAITAALVMAYRAIAKLLGGNAARTPPAQVHKTVRCESCGVHFMPTGESGGIETCNNCVDAKKARNKVDL
ncbi:MAG: hypothetical protein ACNYPG_04965 [Candidatus Porifericomitaceae bacterium WSBS_2022_MAG_OTU9]